MKIAAIVPYNVYPAKMGGQKGINDFYDHFAALKPITWLTVESNQAKPNKLIEPVVVFGNGKLRYLSFSSLINFLKAMKVMGITHLILEHPYCGWMGIIAKTFLKVKLIIHSHNIESLRFRSTGKRWWKILWHYERFVHRHSDLNFFISEEDKEYAIQHFGLKSSRCVTIPYGIEANKIPLVDKKEAASKTIRKTHQISETTRLYFFNGTLDYPPNKEALDAILEEINPRLIKNSGDYKIIICGKSLPQEYDELKPYLNRNIIYAGFVDDINLYFLGTDVFINPVISGGGIKTKLVEALSLNLTSVSTKSGAIGVPLSATGTKMLVSKDGDWEKFVLNMREAKSGDNTPESFFNLFYWEAIAKKAMHAIHNAD